MKQRKCDNCNVWNTDSIRCEACNHPLIAEELHREFVEHLDKEFDNKEKSKFEIFVNKMKESSNVLVKGTYYFFFSLWTIYMFIVSVFVFIIATTPG
ncbi:MAG: hypothetical protein ACI8Q1_000025 [Parvicella sp.]|jgi:hypothetical protein